MMKPLSKESEAVIMSAIEQACDYVDSGMSPTAALKKVAQDKNLSQDFIRLVGAGYNTGAVTHQRETSDDILSKHASLALADIEYVISDLFNAPAVPEKVAKKAHAIAEAYFSSPVKPPKTKAVAVKMAAAKKDEEEVGVYSEKKVESKKETDGNTKYRRAIKFVDSYRLGHKKAQDAYVAAQEALMQKMSFVAQQFYTKKAQQDLPIILAASRQKFGSVADRIIQYVEADRRLPATEAGNLLKFAGVINWNSDPYRAIAEAVDAAKNVLTAKSAFEQAAAELNDAKQKAYSELLPKKEQPVDESDEKSAGIFDTSVALGLNQSVRSLLTPKAPADLVRDAALDLSDPDQERELNAVRAQTAVHDLMRNDDVLSGYDPAEIVSAYNEIADIAPRVSYRIGAMRPLLRKRLVQGYLEPFEINELARLDKTLGESDVIGRPSFPTPKPEE